MISSTPTTRLAPSATPGQNYGLFTGRAESTLEEVTPTRLAFTGSGDIRFSGSTDIRFTEG